MQQNEVLTRMCEHLLLENKKQYEQFEDKIKQLQAQIAKLLSVNTLVVQQAESFRLSRPILAIWHQVWQALGCPSPAGETTASAALRAVLLLKRGNHNDE